MIQKSAIPLLAALALNAQGAVPLDSATPDQENPPLPTDEAIRIPRNAYGEAPTADLPYHDLFRNTNTPYAIGTSDSRLTPSFRPADTVRVRGNLDLPDFRGRFPLLQRGFAPEDADLKIGPLYFKLRQISAGVLWSDNVRHSNQNRESDTRGIASIGGQVIWQITEASRLAASGNFVWLPFDDRAGLTGFSIRSPLSFGLASSPNAQIQASWEPTIFGIPWVFADEFRTGVGRYTTGVHDSFEIFEGFHLNNDPGNTDTSLYAFRSNRDRNTGSFRFEDNNGSNEILFFSNEISAATRAKVPGDFNFRFRAAHENLWYPDNEDLGLPSERNTVFAGLDSYRESLRFKPYLHYQLNHRPDPDRIYQSVRLGVRGPVTDLISFDGNFGYLWENRTGRESFLWHARLEHIINPRTRHALEWSKNLFDLSNEVSQHVRYQFSHVLGPGLTTDLYAGYHWVEDLDDVFPDREDFRTGLRLNWRVSPRTSIRLWGQYTDFSVNDGSFDTETWRGRFELSHRLYDRIHTRLIYQHTELESSVSSATYDENLLFFSLSYYFE